MNLAENLSVNIHEQVSYVGDLTQTPGQTPRDNEGPEDKNLTCLKCGRVYKIGEIQYYSKHCIRIAKGNRETEKCKTAVYISADDISVCDLNDAYSSKTSTCTFLHCL